MSIQAVLIPKDSLFTGKQFDRLSNIMDNAGQVAIGSLVLDPLIHEGQTNITLLLYGLTTVG